MSHVGVHRAKKSDQPETSLSTKVSRCVSNAICTTIENVLKNLEKMSNLLYEALRKDQSRWHAGVD